VSAERFHGTQEQPYEWTNDYENFSLLPGFTFAIHRLAEPGGFHGAVCFERATSFHALYRRSSPDVFAESLSPNLDCGFLGRLFRQYH
jgi:hypothetical protein